MLHQMNSYPNSFFMKQGVATYINDKINHLWSDLQGLSLLTFGNFPYHFIPQSHPRYRIHGWFPNEIDFISKPIVFSNLKTCYLTYDQFPFQKCSFNRIIYHHTLNTNFFQFNQILRSCWETLNDNGKMLLLLPNKLKWWSIFNVYSFLNYQKNSFLMYQLKNIFNEHMFELIYHKNILYFPPQLMNSLSLSINKLLEFLGHFFIPFGGEYHLIEICKNLYAPIMITPIINKRLLKQLLS